MSQKIHKSDRNSAFELLRIIAMVFIVLSHACVHSQFDLATSAITLNSQFVQWGVLGNLGVDIFVLISGYFLCQKKNNYQSIIRLLLQVWFYSFALFLICKFGFNYPYSFKEMIRVIFPTIFQEYWFFTAYFVLVLLSPYINIFLSKADRKTVRNLLAIMFVLWIIVPTFTLQNMYSSPLAQLIFFYSVGAYCRLYPDCTIKNKQIILGLTSVSFALLFALTFVRNFLGQYSSFLQDRDTVLYSRDSLLIVSCAIGLFLYFMHMPAFTNRLINTISKCTFGVYLIHDNPAVRSIIWLRIFKHSEHFMSDILIVRILVSVVIVFSVSILIEYLRMKTIGKYCDRLSDYVSNLLKKYVS